jgi:hypothetical protein
MDANSNIDDTIIEKKSKDVALFRLVQALFLLIAVIWVLFGVLNLSKMIRGITVPTFTAWVVMLLMFVNGGVMLWIRWGLGRGKRGLFTIAIVFLATNIILTVTDEFGVYDLVTLLIDAVILVLLIATRSRYSADTGRAGG